MTMPVSQLREVPDHAVFVGRQAELAQLRAGINRASRRRGSLFLLAGEPGIGKTRLTEQIAAEAQDRASAVYWGLPHRPRGRRLTGRGSRSCAPSCRTLDRMTFAGSPAGASSRSF